jgi:FecR protein
LISNFSICLLRVSASIAVILIFCGGIQTAFAENVPPAGIVVTFGNKVTVLRGGQTLDAGMKYDIFEGDQLVVGPQRTALVMLRDKSRIIINPNSSWKLEKSMIKKAQEEPILTQVSQLIRGRITVDVAKQNRDSEFTVKTRTAVMGVRGTQFVVSTGRESTRLVVVEGEVTFARKESKDPPIVVAKNQSVYIRAETKKVVVEPAPEEFLNIAAVDLAHVSSDKMTKEVARDYGAELNQFFSKTIPLHLSKINPFKVAPSDWSMVFAYHESFSSISNVIFGSPGYGVRFWQLSPAVNSNTFLDWGMNVGYHQNSFRDVVNEISTKIDFYELGINMRHGFGRGSSSFEPNWNASARFRSWNAKAYSKPLQQEKLASGLDYGPALGLAIPYFIASNLVLSLEGLGGAWLTTTRGVDITGSLTLGWRIGVK